MCVYGKTEKNEERGQKHGVERVARARDPEERGRARRDVLKYECTVAAHAYNSVQQFEHRTLWCGASWEPGQAGVEPHQTAWDPVHREGSPRRSELDGSAYGEPETNDVTPTQQPFFCTYAFDSCVRSTDGRDGTCAGK